MTSRQICRGAVEGTAMEGEPLWVVAGPTASGKSALALDLAEAFRGTIINADALQLYRELPILTAQPDRAALDRVPHRLYGCLSAGEPASAGLWRGRALAEVEAALSAGRRPILVGGTGLYLKALSQGLSPVPPVPRAERDAAGDLLERIGPAALHARLAGEDPRTAARLSPNDSQRILRAWSVLRASGRPLSYWRDQKGEPGPALRWLVLLPDRDRLREAVATRFDAMLQAGALQEVETLVAQGLSDDLPAMKAVGVRELSAVLSGGLSLDEARTRAIAATRQYLKRQTTWLRHQVMAEEPRLHVWYAQYSYQLGAEIVRFLRDER